ncbi:MAG: class I SAM-dependent methyltransferase [Anaerolineae bacterium]|nr:class I SAM-dependent methyltransferase [Anaerolineae bacterium]MCB0253347.1 class I SAM-dependent methyltransferase [Anaerolineae bacterium]
MDEYLQANQKLWDQWTTEHEQSPFYDVDGFRAGKDRLRSIELAELGNVAGKSLLHLQCHFGMDTLAWARRGASATGVDLSEKSIELARTLSRELAIPADFVCCDIYDLPRRLDGTFDIVFTSYGVLHWLRDLKPWGRIIAHFLKPGGIFYIVEDHPAFRMFTTGEGATIELANPYFFSEIPHRVEMSGSYATDNQGEAASFYLWDHGISDVINALVGAGLTIEFLHEFPYAARAKFPFMQQGADGWWRLPPEYVQIPFLFSLQARRPV